MLLGTELYGLKRATTDALSHGALRHAQMGSDFRNGHQLAHGFHCRAKPTESL
jgi:hypothetical protein